MNKRVMTPELADALARRATIPVSFSEHFVQSFFDIIEEALTKDKLVKVKGLGTFKLVDVDERESVDVRTGERIMLMQHSKVSFTPDPALRDTINKPFADFDTVILNEETPSEQMEVVEEEEAKQPAAEAEMEEKETVPEDSQPAALEEPAQATEEAIIQPEEEVINQPEEKVVTQPEKEVIIQPKEEPAQAEAETPTPPQQTEETAQPSEKKETPKKKTMERNILSNIITALVSLFVGYAVCFYLRPFELPTIKPAEPRVANVDESVVTYEDTLAAETPSEASPTEQAEAQPAPKNNYPQLEGGEYEIVGVKGSEVMSPGKTLLNISLKYYGSKDFVAYICAMNGITNPDVVPLDKELQIPELRKK